MCSGVLPKPIPGSIQMRASAIPCPDRELDPLGEERLDVVDDVPVGGVVLHGPRRALHVHEHDLAPAFGTEAGQTRVGDKAVTSLTIARPASSAASRDGRLRGVDRDVDPSGGQPRDHGLRARGLLGRRHLRRPRARGLAADIDDLGPVGGELKAMRDRLLGVQVKTAVRERVGGTLTMPMRRAMGGG